MVLTSSKAVLKGLHKSKPQRAQRRRREEVKSPEAHLTPSIAVAPSQPQEEFRSSHILAVHPYVNQTTSLQTTMRLANNLFLQTKACMVHRSYRHQFWHCAAT